MGVEHDLYDLHNVRTFYLGKSYALVEALRELLQEKEIVQLLSLEMVEGEEDALARHALVQEFLHACLEEHESGPWYERQIERLTTYLAEARGKVGLGSDSDGSDFDFVALSAGFVRLLSVYEEGEEDQFCVRDFDSVEALRGDIERRQKQSTDVALHKLPGSDPYTSWHSRLGNLARIDSGEFWFLCEKRDVLLYTEEKALRPEWPWNSVATCDGKYVPFPSDEILVERHYKRGAYETKMVWRKHPHPFSRVVTKICEPFRKV